MFSIYNNHKRMKIWENTSKISFHISRKKMSFTAFKIFIFDPN